MSAIVGAGTVGSPRIVSANQGNYGVRGLHVVDTIVLHVTQSRRNAAQLVAESPPSAVLWFADPRAQASAHYTIGCDGSVWASVPEAFCAWHAGNSGVNRRSIGIEIEGWVDRPETFNPEAMAAVVLLCSAIVTRHRVPIVHQPGPGICGHCDVPDPTNQNMRGGLHHHTDPGPLFPWAHFFAALHAELSGVA